MGDKGFLGRNACMASHKLGTGRDAGENLQAECQHGLGENCKLGGRWGQILGRNASMASQEPPLSPLLLDRHPHTTRQTPYYYTDTQLLDRQPTTRQTPKYLTDTQVLDTRQTPNYSTDTQVLDRHPSTR